MRSRRRRHSVKRTLSDQMQRLVQEYRDSGQSWPASSRDMARWMIRTKRWDRGDRTMIKLCAKDISNALREEYHTDPQGRRVRTKHAAKLLVEGTNEQMTFWDDIRTAPREFMERAFKQRRNQIVGDCIQLSTDVESYNENMCADNPIQMLLDFRDDVAESRQSGKLNSEGASDSSDDSSSEFELPSLQSPFDVSRRVSVPETFPPLAPPTDPAPRRPGSSAH